jgi:hypothetical protein
MSAKLSQEAETSLKRADEVRKVQEKPDSIVNGMFYFMNGPFQSQAFCCRQHLLTAEAEFDECKVCVFLGDWRISSSSVDGLLDTVLLGAEHYGYPLAWLIRFVLAPEYSPWRVNIPNLIVNVAVWIGIVSTLLFILTRARKM